MYLVVFWSKLYTSILYLLLIASFYLFDKIHYYLNQKYNFYTANWDLFSMYIYSLTPNYGFIFRITDQRLIKHPVY